MPDNDPPNKVEPAASHFGNLDSDVYLIQSEAAKHLRVSSRTLERWRIEGTGPPWMRFGRRVTYSLKGLTAWAITRTFTSTAEADVSA
jgi:hypothetical protein